MSSQLIESDEVETSLGSEIEEQLLENAGKEQTACDSIREIILAECGRMLHEIQY